MKFVARKLGKGRLKAVLLTCLWPDVWCAAQLEDAGAGVLVLTSPSPWHQLLFLTGSSSLAQ